MRTLKLNEVVPFTGIESMSVAEAQRYVSRNQSRQITKNQALALSMLTVLNTPQDWLRLQACLVLLRATRASAQ